ncbi:MAG: hypothetical protein KBD23_00660 [Gammaproteobacteria bacterium]|nr:hypothetical protein [Gammaproteobacteria bacterium]
MKNILLLLSMACLTGCGNQAFDCPYKDGLRCVRLSEVDRRIDEGTLIKSASASTQTASKFKVHNAPLNQPMDALTLWVAPYQSKEGIIHEQQWIHFVANDDKSDGMEGDLD